MILKPIKSEFNQDFHDSIWKAKNYIRDHYDELKKLPNGKHLLDKEICEGAFINVTEYDNKDNPPWESHLKYVDVQIIFEGAEDFIIANTSTLKPKSYDEASDYHDWEGEGTVRLTLSQGEILILLPYDAHRVGLPPKSGKNHVKKAIFLSTDKAAYPINAMGITKALMEKNVIARSRQMLPTDPVLCLTRYGNVMASRGSVIPYFLEQISEGKPITITNPDMTRFMMTLEDAVDLVLYAFEHGEQGDLFVQKAPAATIDTLAKAIIELTGSKTGVAYIGTRHGEKLYETLVTSEEMAKAISLPGFYRIPADNRDLNYDKYVEKGNHALENVESYNSHNTERLDVEGMKKQLLRLDLFKK